MFAPTKLLVVTPWRCRLWWLVCDWGHSSQSPFSRGISRTAATNATIRRLDKGQRCFVDNGRGWSFLDRLQANGEMETTPVSQGALHPEPSLHRLHQTSGDGQAQAGSSELPGNGAIRLRERVEDQVLFLRRDPDAGVPDGEM